MTYTPVIPASYQTDRQDLNDALGVLIDAFIVSESYAVGRKFMSEMPDSLTGEGPLIVLGDITETVQHTMQLRITTFSGSIFYIDSFPSRTEYNTRVNAFADRMRDLLTYNVQITGKGELRQVSFAEDERQQGRIIVGAPHVDYEYIVQEGYQ